MIDGLHDGPLEVSADECRHLSVTGLVVGTTRVRPAADLALWGQLGGDLIVEAGASAALHGLVCGNLFAAGVVDLYGVVLGSVYRGDGGDCVVHHGAQVQDTPRPLAARMTSSARSHHTGQVGTDPNSPARASTELFSGRDREWIVYACARIGHCWSIVRDQDEPLTLHCDVCGSIRMVGPVLSPDGIPVRELPADEPRAAAPRAREA
ncbi:MAG TPA: hypothetical protein VHC41_04360 [Mycobacteriales bacterium]|nr:hypothetical protein [Mycobacteriales bacterium]